MTQNWQANIQQLLNHTRIGFLSSHGATTPETSMCPYAIHKGKIILHLSGLAKHSKNIALNPNVGFMICTPEDETKSPLALARLSFTGQLQPADSDLKQQFQQTYCLKIPESEPLFDFPDFQLYTLAITNVFWVGGFGSARNISLETWASL